jgi:hypothetical protein
MRKMVSAHGDHGRFVFHLRQRVSGATYAAYDTQKMAVEREYCVFFL